MEMRESLENRREVEKRKEGKKPAGCVPEKERPARPIRDRPGDGMVEVKTVQKGEGGKAVSPCRNI